VPLPRALTALETAWLAGLLEGEGSFIVTSKKRERAYGTWQQITVRIQIAMIDRDVIGKVAALLGTGVWKKAPSDPKYQMQYATHASGPRACAVMTSVRPYMGSRRREQIDHALLAFREAPKHHAAWPHKFRS
jgi:hypothetical protein